jgi:hypothetical protein
MRKTIFIEDFEKEAKEGTNEEHLNAVMIEFRKKWKLNLDNLNKGSYIDTSIDNLRVLQGFRTQKGSLEEKQIVLDELNLIIGK